MFSHCELVLLILALTLDHQVHTIIGGKEAVPHSRPYMVLVERKMENNRDPKYCAGFLLNEEFVLTAANCQAKYYKAWLGVHDFRNKKWVQNVSVKQAFQHENYSQLTPVNDIMLLKLSSMVRFNKNVKGIALADEGDGSLPKSCLVSGWGRTENSKYLSEVLIEVNVTLYDNKQCAERNQYCSEEKNGPGKGDGGGPLVCEGGKAYGVVSHRMDLQQTEDQSIYVFTKIPDYRSWINSIIEHHGEKATTVIKSQNLNLCCSTLKLNC